MNDVIKIDKAELLKELSALFAKYPNEKEVRLGKGVTRMDFPNGVRTWSRITVEYMQVRIESENSTKECVIYTPQEWVDKYNESK